MPAFSKRKPAAYECYCTARYQARTTRPPSTDAFTVNAGNIRKLLLIDARQGPRCLELIRVAIIMAFDTILSVDLTAKSSTWIWHHDPCLRHH